MTLLGALPRGNPDGVTFDIGRSNAAGRPGPCGDMTFRQKPSAREQAKCSAWAKCLGMPGDCDQARRVHKSYKAKRESSGVWFRLLHHQLRQIPRLQPVLLA